MNFKQAMIVPTMVSLGVGALLVAKNLQLMEVSYAAPAAPGAPAVPAPGAPGAGGAAANQPGPGALPLPANAAAGSPEFGQGGGTKVIRAITESELALKAVEASGREDPFMALLPPEPGSIQPPPVTFVPIKPIAPEAPAVATLPKPPVTPGTPGKPPITKPKVEDLPFAGDKAPAAQEPQWLVRGIMTTGLERITLLEGRDETVHARVGDVLADGSKVVAISSRGVTFIRGGRRFLKQIGGSN